MIIIIISVLFRRYIIRHTKKIKINNKLINNEILKKHVNSVILILNRIKQLKYYHVHKIYIKESLDSAVKIVNNDLEKIINIYHIKNLLYASVCS